MKIKNNFSRKDEVSGLTLTVIEGESIDCLRIENAHNPHAGAREFFFTKNGEFDGAGSEIVNTDNAITN